MSNFDSLLTPRLAPSKPKTFKGWVAVIVIALVAIFSTAVLALEAWITMLILGGLHADVSDKIYPYGYDASFLIVLALSWLLFMVKGIDVNKIKRQ